ncbi:MAG: hypothetical protein SLAVMIC_00529 [uncultured marine phage]|uniref:Uncharacterized protein n=1 Tax=uncultured marine phage TaxID=707152 RepID=A0A8D9C931_9VIRU|nr:MAG: hypothetical protein SLAVMIC_00529 [uncultured marine phage]
MKEEILFYENGLNSFDIIDMNSVPPNPKWHIVQEVKPRWWSPNKKRFKPLNMKIFVPICGHNDCYECKDTHIKKNISSFNRSHLEIIIEEVKEKYKSIHRERRLKKLLNE